jgi:hypothetical protein
MRKISVLLLMCVYMIGLRAQTTGTLAVSTNTSPTSSPDYTANILAIWVEDSNGKFVSSVLVYAIARIADLTTWDAVSGRNVVNATTGATLKAHGTRTCTWNGKDFNKMLAADGNYVLKMELTDNSGGVISNKASFPFVKGASVQSQTALSQNGFTAVSIVWTPAGTSISDVELSEKYQIYPSPTKSNIFVNGYDIKSIDIVTQSGQLLFTSTQQNINLSSLSNGVYLVSITTNSGEVIVKKVIKE